MYFTDVPNLPPQSVSVMIAQNDQAKQSKSKNRIMGVCSIIPNGAHFDKTSAENGIAPADEVVTYLKRYENKTAADYAKVSFLQNPKHGEFQLIGESVSAPTNYIKNSAELVYRYLPESGYFGKDKAIALVEIGGLKVKVIYYFQVIDSIATGNTTIKDMCGKKGYHWKISSSSPDGTSTFTSDDASSTATSDYAISSADFAGYNYLPLNITFANLTGAAVGETTGEGLNANITLDTDAAGHGWYIGGLTTEDGGQVQRTQDGGQATELGMLSSVFSHQSSDWLPTSNPNEWVARTGTGAETNQWGQSRLILTNLTKHLGRPLFISTGALAM